MTLQWCLRPAALAAALALAACGMTPTPYEPRGVSGGWVEKQLSGPRWVVEFHGNSATDRDTMTGFWLHRCAELTAEKGYDYFVLVRGAAADARGLDGWNLLYGESAWLARGVIELRKGVSNDDDPSSFDAQDLLKTLGPAVRGATSRGENIRLPKQLAAGRERRRGGTVQLEDLQGLLPKQ